MPATANNYDILIISDDVVGKKMAGPGIRAWELSRCLAQYFRVVLAVPDYSPLSSLEKEKESGEQSLELKSSSRPHFHQITQKSSPHSFDLTTYSLANPSPLRELVQRSQVIIIQGYILSKFPFLKKTAAHLIIDLYVPFPLENLFVHKWKVSSRKEREFIHHNDLRVFNEQILYGDHFLCASQRQRDLFLGSLLSLNRINPATLDFDPDLTHLISIVPFGIAGDGEEARGGENEKKGGDMATSLLTGQQEKEKDLAAKNTERAGESRAEPGPLRQRLPQGGKDDIVLLWGGVISNWFDPLILIKAVKKVSEQDPRVKLFFLSTSHPNPLLPEFDLAREAVKLAQELNLFDKFVFFNHEWVDYDRRGEYFRDADIGVSIHHLHFETYFSFRTRILDYFKYELPIICTEGDCLAEMVKERELGLVVPAGDEEALVQAIIKMMGDRQFRSRSASNIRQLKPHFYWSTVTKPLICYCQEVLAGKVRKEVKSSPAKVATLLAKPKNPWREIGKKIFGFRYMRWSPSLAAKVKRLLKM